MDIIVLLKQVPATESMITAAPDGKRIQTDNLKWVMNPYDEFAVEEALQIKQKQGGSVTVLSAGSDKTAEALRTALAMGADNAVLINDPAAENCDSLGIAKILAAAVKTMPYDLIIAGMRAVDDDCGIVGGAVAGLLQIPHISMVVKEEITDRVIRCRSTVEGGTVVTEAPLPVLFTTQRGLNAFSENYRSQTGSQSLGNALSLTQDLKTDLAENAISVFCDYQYICRHSMFISCQISVFIL